MSLCRWGQWKGSPYVYNDYNLGLICHECTLNDGEDLTLKDEDEAYQHIEIHRNNGGTMGNKLYGEDGEGSDLPQKVKGPKGEAPAFKEFSNPGGVGDGEAQNINGGGVKMPQDSEKHLPKAGKTS